MKLKFIFLFHVIQVRKYWTVFEGTYDLKSEYCHVCQTTKRVVKDIFNQLDKPTGGSDLDDCWKLRSKEKVYKNSIYCIWYTILLWCVKYRIFDHVQWEPVWETIVSVFETWNVNLNRVVKKNIVTLVVIIYSMHTVVS